MSLHENEHSGKSVRRAVEHGTGNHFARISSQARRNPNSPHARAEQIGNANTQSTIDKQRSRKNTTNSKTLNHQKIQKAVYRRVHAARVVVICPRSRGHEAATKKGAALSIHSTVRLFVYAFGRWVSLALYQRRRCSRGPVGVR